MGEEVRRGGHLLLLLRAPPWRGHERPAHRGVSWIPLKRLERPGAKSAADERYRPTLREMTVTTCSTVGPVPSRRKNVFRAVPREHADSALYAVKKDELRAHAEGASGKGG